MAVNEMVNSQEIQMHPKNLFFSVPFFSEENIPSQWNCRQGKKAWI